MLVVDRHKQASKVSSAILFPVLLFIRFIIEKALSQMYLLLNMEKIFCAKSLKWGTALCLQASKMCHNAHSFLTKKVFDGNLRNS